MGLHISQQSSYLEIHVVMAARHVEITLAQFQRWKDSTAGDQGDHDDGFIKKC